MVLSFLNTVGDDLEVQRNENWSEENYLHHQMAIKMSINIYTNTCAKMSMRVFHK